MIAKRHVIIAALLAVMAPLTATTVAAQPADDAVDQQTPQNRGPMIVERVHSGFLVAPDVKVTRVDRTTSELAGAYAGWLTDQTFFIGGGAYVLANGSRDRRMAYGGLVVQWSGGRDQSIGWSPNGDLLFSLPVELKCGDPCAELPLPTSVPRVESHFALQPRISA